MICMHCGRHHEDTDRPWNTPCPDSPDRLHWTQQQLDVWAEARLTATAQSLRRAALELGKVANAVEALAPRLQRKLPFELEPDVIRNEAERARDTLHVYGLLDV